MNKRVISLFLAIALVVVTAMSSFAATRSGQIRPVDLTRFQRCVSNVRGKNANIINYQQQADGSYMVRLRVRDNEGKGDQCEGDFRVAYYGPKAPERNVSFGPCWYWFGLLGDVDTPEQSQLVGYGYAVRTYQGMAAIRAGKNQPYGFTMHDWWCTDTGLYGGTFTGKNQ